MLRFLIPFFMFLSFVGQSYSQEPLWRKGGSFNGVEYQAEKDIQTYNNLGLHYNKKDIYVARSQSSTIEYFDSTTLIRKTVENINGDGSTSEVSPHCRIIVLHDVDTLRLYDVKKKSVIYSRIGTPKVLAFSDDSRFTLFADGSVIDLNDTLKPEPLKVKIALNSVYGNTKADWSKDGKVLLWNSYGDSIRIYDAIHGTDANIPYKSAEYRSCRFSHNGKAIVAFTHDSVTVLSIENGKLSIILDDKDIISGSDYHFWNDDHLLVLKDNSIFLLYNLLTKGIDVGVEIPLKSFAYAPRFLNHDTSIVKQTIPLISYETSGCGGMPDLTNALLHSLKIDTKLSFQTLPNKQMECVRGMCFMEGDTTVATVNCNNTIIITGIRDGKIKRQWDIPKGIYTGKKLVRSFEWVNTQLLTSGEYLIFTAGNMLYRFSVKKGDISDSVRVGDSSITFITHSLDKKYILACSDKTVFAYESDNFSFVKNFVQNQKVSNVSLSNDTLLCAFAGNSQISRTLFSTGTGLEGYTIQGTYPILSLGGQSAALAYDSTVALLNPPLKLKHHNTLFQFGWTTIKRVINADKLWLIAQYRPEMFGVPASTSVSLYMESNGSLSDAFNYSISSSCNGENIFISDNGKYCVSLGRYGTMELHEINFVPVSVHDNASETIVNDEQGYSITGEYLHISDTKNYTGCDLYTVTGEHIGICPILNNENSTRITIPNTVQNGFYIIALRISSGVISKRIIVNR